MQTYSNDILILDRATSEYDLIAAVKEGDKNAFGVIYETHRQAVYSFIYRSIGQREDADDLVQEVFCKAWQSMHSFRGEAKLLTWLYRIAARLCIDRARGFKYRSSCNSGLDCSDIESVECQTEDIQQRIIIRQTINDELMLLSLDQRALVILCDIQGFTCKEAAYILECSSISARVRLCQAHKKLRRALSDVAGEVLRK